MDYLATGERVGLGPLRRDLVGDYQRWMNDPAVSQPTTSTGIETEETEVAWFERASQAGAERVPTQASFTVYDLSDDAAVGSTSLFDIDHLHGTGTFGIVIGERRGQGLGTDTTRLVLRWAWDVLGLHNVLLTVLPWNEAAVQAYRNAGFEELGLRRNAIWSRGERIDQLLMQAVRA
jgi:RimJ/RimL family protein N-acetyltransferase